MLHLPGQTLPDWAAHCATVRGGGAGIIESLPISEYHGTRALLGNTSLGIAQFKSGRHFKHWLDHGYAENETQAKLLGNALHCIVLEPDEFARRYAITPYFGPLGLPKNRARRDAWEQEQRGKIILPNRTKDDLDTRAMLEGQRDSLLTHPFLGRLFRRGTPELTALAVDPATGIALKVRGDWVDEDAGVFVDLKRAFDASEEGMRRAAREHHYIVQDPLYCRVFDLNDVHIEHFVFAAVEPTPPYAVGFYQVSDAGRLAGEHYYQSALMRVARWVEQGYFPHYNEDRPIELGVTNRTLEEAETSHNAESAHYG